MVNQVEMFANQLTAECFSHEGEYPSVFGNHDRWKPGREAKCCAYSKKGGKFAWSTGCVFKVITCGKSKHNSSNTVSNRIIDCGNEIRAMEFASDFRLINKNVSSTSLLAVGLAEGGIKIWDVDTGVLVFHLSDHQSCVTGLSFAPCKTPILVSCSHDKTLKIWDLEDDGNMTLTLKDHKFPILDCSFSPVNKQMLASVGMGKLVLIWKFEHKRSCRVLHRLRSHKHDVVSCCWSPDGALLATASHDTTAVVWDPHLNQALLLLCHQHPLPSPIYAGGANGSWVRSVSFSSDGLKIATVCEDNRLRVWKPLKSKVLLLESDLSETGYQCRFSPDGRSVAVGKENGAVTVASEYDSDVLPLTHLSRMAARRALTSAQVCDLLLPNPIRDFLLYRRPLD